MTDIVTGNQIDIAAFDSGVSSPYLEQRRQQQIKERRERNLA